MDSTKQFTTVQRWSAVEEMDKWFDEREAQRAMKPLAVKHYEDEILQNGIHQEWDNSNDHE